MQRSPLDLSGNADASATGPLAPPHSIEAEESVLGAILLSERAMYGVVIEETLRPDDFYRKRHELIFEAMIALYRQGDPIDHLTVREHLRAAGQLDTVGGPHAVDTLAANVPAAGNVRHYAGIVRDLSVQRGVLRASYEVQAAIAQGGGDPAALVDKFAAQLLSLNRHKTGSYNSLLADAEWERVAEITGDAEPPSGILTGIPDLDAVVNGFRPGQLVVIAARPSMGKSSITEQIALEAADDQAVPTAFFSLEMSRQEVVDRSLAAGARVNLNAIRSKVTSAEAEKLVERAAKSGARQAPFIINDRPGMTLLDIRGEAMQHHAKFENGLGLIVVDFLQLIRDPNPGGATRAELVGGFAYDLKSLARELSCVVIAVSQLNRAATQRENKRPTLADLAESGKIEQAADIVLFLHRDDYYDKDERPGEADVIVAKNRNGSLDDVTVAFQGKYQAWLPLPAHSR